MNTSVARLGSRTSRTLGVEISTAFLSVLLLIASVHRVSACVGDCDASADVTVNEIIILVNIALGTQHVSDCPHGLPATATDADVTVSVIIQAVNNALIGCTAMGTPTPTNIPTPLPTSTNTPTSTSPFVGEFTGTGAVTFAAGENVTGQVTIVIGANRLAGAVFQNSSGAFGTLNGVADLVTGAVTLTQSSEQLSGGTTVSLQLEASGSSITGNGTVIVSDPSGSGTITIPAQVPGTITSNYVGVYLGTINFTGGPEAGNSWPIELFVANDGTAGAVTFDTDGNGFQFQGTVNLTSGAFTLAVNRDSGFPGITGSISGTLPNGTFNLSNGDTGTVSFPKVAP